jgi:tetratricopeptide (TPR) repeat protein
MSSAFKKILVVLIVLIVVAFAALTTYVYVEKTGTIAREEEKQATLQDTAVNFALGDMDEAIRQAEELVSEDSDNVAALLALAASYAGKGNASFEQSTYAQKAIDTAKMVLEIDPDNSEAYRIIGYAHETLENYDVARQNYRLAIDLDARNAQAHSNMGHSYDLQGDFERAGEWYGMALKIDPNLDHALLNSARLSVRTGNIDAAKIAVQKLVGSVNANYASKAEAYLIIALIALNENVPPNYDAARTAVNQALAHNPDLPQAWVLSALVKYQSLLQIESDEAIEDQFDSIAKDIETALSINTNQASAYYVGYLLAQLREPEAVETWRTAALAAIPHDITLGEVEKENMKALLEAQITVTSHSEIE